MPYDDSDVKKMIKHQIERKVGFSRRVRLSEDVMNLIHSILEARVDHRFTTDRISEHPWMTSPSPPPSAAVSSAGSPISMNASANNKRQPVKSESPRTAPGKRDPTVSIPARASVAVGADDSGRMGAAGVSPGAEAMVDHSLAAAAAAAAVDGLSHNNSARGPEPVPRPLDKTKKTTQLNLLLVNRTLTLMATTDVDDSSSTLRALFEEDDDIDQGEVWNNTKKKSYYIDVRPIKNILNLTVIL
jgi:hypothetical protein